MKHTPPFSFSMLAAAILLGGGAGTPVTAAQEQPSSPKTAASKTEQKQTEAPPKKARISIALAKKQTKTPRCPFTLTGKTDRDRAVYAAGEKITFTLAVRNSGKPVTEGELRWKLVGDDGLKKEGVFPMTDGKDFVCTASMKTPGFVYLHAEYFGKDGKQIKTGERYRRTLVFDGGAGVEIDKVRVPVREPADFDAFWAKQKARLQRIPMVPVVKEMPKHAPGIRVYSVEIPCAGPRPVTGYLTVPEGALAKSLPAVLNVHGYGASRQIAPAGGPKKMLSFSINAHGMKLDADKEYYTKFLGSLKGYALREKAGSPPDQLYFNGMVLRVLRALEYLKSRPEWNGKLTISGGSQGGLQSIWGAALDPDVTECRPSIPWGCCIAENGAWIRRAWGIRHVPSLDYYDAVNHAKRIRCRVHVPRMGLGDYICPPAGVMTMFNALSCPKSMKVVQGSTHGYVPQGGQSFLLKGGK